MFRNCSICGFENLPHQIINGIDEYWVECPRCGTYGITRSAERIDILDENVKPRLSAWLREREESKLEPLLLNSASIKDIIRSLPRYGAIDKQRILLQNLEKKTSHPGATVEITPSIDYPLAWSENEQEFDYHLQSLLDRGLLQSLPGYLIGVTRSYVITAAGWEYLDQHRQVRTDSDQAFVAMWFSDEMDPAWTDAIKPAVTAAGYKPYRVDVDPHNEKIDTKIMAEIKRSRFVITDVTGQRNGVYFEAGYALGLGLPVIWTVRKDDLENIHFDTRQYNHIVWKTPEDLASRLSDFIIAIIGKRVSSSSSGS